MSSSSPTVVPDTRHFRDVLGHFPTGVAVITALSADGAPCGMAVGSFSSVSLDPPLIAFMPARTSTTFPVIAAAPHFCVSILGADQERVCQSMATRGADKFAEIEWFPAPSGAPIIAGSLAWIDCTPVDTREAGDHFIVLGHVDRLSELRPGPPLVFVRGGYGGFSPTSLVAHPERDLMEPIRLAGRARRPMENLATDVALECLAVSEVVDETVCLAIADAPGAAYTSSRVGYRTPARFPAGAVFHAWDDHPTSRWLPDDDARRTTALNSLERVRNRRWSIAIGDAKYDDLERAVGRLHVRDTADEPLETLVHSLDSDCFDIELSPESTYDVRLLMAPVFGPEGVVMALGLRGFERHLDRNEIESIAERLVVTADEVSRKIGGGDQLPGEGVNPSPECQGRVLPAL